MTCGLHMAVPQATLARRLRGINQHVKDAIDSMNPAKVEHNLKVAKGLFVFHTQQSGGSTVRAAVCMWLRSCDGAQLSLEDLSLDLKSGGNFSLEQEVRVAVWMSCALMRLCGRRRFWRRCGRAA